MASLNIEQVWKKYGDFIALRDINLDIQDGEFIVLVGPSGCGKSTLLSIIAGLEETSHGTLTMGTRDVTDLSPKDRNIALVFQSYALYPTMTVQQNITFGMENRKVPKAEQDKAVADVAKLLQIEPLLDRKPSQLSGGQRQRVAMGRALVRDPQLFLFDEPLSNLDAKLRVEMRTEIKKLHKRLGQTIVYVTHDQVEAMTLSDRIVVMNGGVIQQFADPDTIYQKPANKFVAGFMGSPAMNFLDVEVAGSAGDLRLIYNGDQQEVVFPIADQHPQLERYVGQKVTLGARPEHFQPASEEPGNTVPLSVRIDVVEPTGPDTMVVFTLAGNALVSVMPANFRPEEEEQVDIELKLDDACFFDIATGVRIGEDG
ncbi:sn-glycerol-3-phosphate ABC transporter ATP-binding protein UgpC [Cognatishimia sp. WU-CL00825]|uniref:ABC transporter ATP-binding protein n=1 Tax=Cognatishimia sp. WU-CL00825 TaxID=3127658 RepID=UPI00310A49B2